MKRPRGNPLWGKHGSKREGVTVTAFEKVAAEFQIPEVQWPFSSRLRQWARKHYRSRYIPEHLLTFWGIEVDEFNVTQEIR